MADLAEFLLARIAEDEERARAAQRESSYQWSDNAFTEAVELAEGEGAVKEATEHIAHWDPVRVLAECEAKRQIVEFVAYSFYMDGTSKDEVLGQLALPYADHPDFREKWRPYRPTLTP